MTPFVLVASWSRRDVPRSEVEGLLSGLVQEETDSREVRTVPGAAAASLLRRTTEGEAASHGIEVDWNEGWLAAGNVRLYDRPPSVRSEDDAITDLAHLVRAYRREGPRAVQSAVGDFAFVIFDWRRGRVHAFRDHFGLRPLFYRRTADGMAVASDVRALLAISAGDRSIDPEMATQYLLMRFWRPGHSFFAHAPAVPPGHFVEVGERCLWRTRYWRPRFETFQGDYTEAVHAWRSIFQTAVRDRMVCAGPIAAYLSGGLDSSSVVGAVNDELERRSPDSARGLALSAVFPGLSCDERPYIDSVLARAPRFDSFVWNGAEANHLVFDSPLIPAPGIREGVGRSVRRDYAAMRAAGCRVVLTGDGGDAASLGLGVLADALRASELPLVLQQLVAFRSWRRALRVIQLELSMASVSPSRRPQIPDWLGPEARDVYRNQPSRDELLTPDVPHLARNIWNNISGTIGSYGIDTIVLASSEAGFETRMPYFDIRLVEFVLSVPWRLRLPNADYRRLQRDGAGPLLPDLVRKRRNKAAFDAMVTWQIHANLSRLHAIFSGPEDWLSAPFVDRAKARWDFERLLRSDPGFTLPGHWKHVWRIAVFEAWLRALLGYDAAQGTTR